MNLAAIESEAGRLELRTDGSVVWKRGGAEWRSPGPLLQLHYYDRCHPCQMEVGAPSGLGIAQGTAGTPSLSARGELSLLAVNENKVAVTAKFIGVDIEIDVELWLLDEGREVRICVEEVREANSLTYRALSLGVLPFFGAGATGQGGSMVLPNWSGCQTLFDKCYPRYLRQTVYSSNDEWANNCNAPVFGITADEGTLCGIITAGDMDVRLVSYVHYEGEQLNGCHVDLVYRWQQEDDILAGRRGIRYFAALSEELPGEGYAFCAFKYRDYLREECGVRTWAEKAAMRPEAAEYLDRFFLKIFMAYKDPRPDGLGDFHSVTSFGEAREIIEALLEEGLTKLSVIMVGWGQDGHDGMRPTQFPVDERLGGEEAFRELIQWCGENDVLMGVHDGYGVSYPCSPEHDEAFLIRHRTGEAWRSIVWSGGQMHMVCPKIFVDRFTRRDMAKLADLGLRGHHHIDAIGSFMTCYSPDHPLEKRADFVAEVSKMFELATNTFGGVSTEYPFGPYLSQVDGFFHTYEDPSPWHRETAVGRYFLDRTVPLLPLALHGTHACQCGVKGGEDTELLRKLSLGLVPEAEVSYHDCPAFGPKNFRSRVAALKAAYNLFFGPDELISRLARLEIRSYRELRPRVTETEYEDGTKLVVNYSEEDYDGVASACYRLVEVEAAVAV